VTTMPESKPAKLTSHQRRLVIIILLSAGLGIVVHMLRFTGLEGSALLYIGIPTFIALAFASASPNASNSKTVMGSTLKAITFIILISGPILQEGFVCMVMVAPIFYIVGALVAWPIDHFRKKKIKSNSLKVFILPTILLAMSMEGVFDETSFNRLNVVEHTQIINSRITEVRKRLAMSRPLARPESLLIKIFPRPDKYNANGLAIGDRHWVDISYLKWIYWNKKQGKVQFEVVENQNNIIRFKLISDDSYLSSYMTWTETTVFLQPVSNHRTRVTWRIHFERNIDPAWYVQPLQRYAVASVAKLMVLSLQ